MAYFEFAPQGPKAKKPKTDTVSIRSALDKLAKHFDCEYHIYGSRAYGTSDDRSDANIFFDISKSPGLYCSYLSFNGKQ